MSKKKTVEMAPVLQTMKDYIKHHFGDELMTELESEIALNHKRDADYRLEDVPDEELRHYKVVFDHADTQIIRAEFYRVDRTVLKADMKARFRAGVSRDG